MSAKILDGAAIAREIRDEIAREVAQLVERGIKPGLAVVIVGEDPASQVYVKTKGEACREAGMLIRPLVGGALAVSPPLVIDDEGIAEMTGAFRAGLDAVAAR